MFGLFDWIKVGLGGLAGAAIIAGPAYLYGHHNGKLSAAADALTSSVEIFRERNAIDDEVSSADAAALCGALGLSGDDKAECMRRVFKADAQSRNVGDNTAR